MINKIITYLKQHGIYWMSMFIFFFISSVVILNTIDTYNKGEIEKIEEFNKKAEIREINAIKKADSANIESKLLNSKVSSLEEQLNAQSKILFRMDANYSKSMNELINLKNEKDYISINVGADEQLKFITNYKYSEY